MKKIILALLCGLALCTGAAANTQVPAKDVTVNAAGFNGNLSPADNTTQKAFQTIDDLPIISGVAWGAITGTLSNQTDLQTALNAKAAASVTISTTAPLAGGGDLSSNRTFSIPVATGSANGYLSSADWTTFNSKGSGSVTTVSVVTANGVSGSVATATTTPAITLTLGAITPSSVNGNTITTGSGTLTIAAAKTLTVSNSLTLAGTDATVMTFPSTSATIARTDAANTFTGVQTITNITLPDQGQIKLTVPTTDLKATGPTCGIFNSGYSSSAIGDLVYLDSSSTWQKADNTTSATTQGGFLGIALEVKTSGQALLVALPGSFVYSTTGFPTWTIGGTIYMSTAGSMTQTQPSAANAGIRVVGWGIHADKMFFQPSPDYIVHL